MDDGTPLVATVRIAPIVAGAAGLVLVALILWDHSIQEGDQRLVGQAIATNKAWREHIARDRAASDANHQRQAVLLRGMVVALDVADRYRDSVSHADTLPPPDSTNPVAQHWQIMYTWEVIRADSLSSALDQSQSATLLARADGSRAWRLVEEGRAASLLSDEAIRSRQCHILMLPCPSRTVVAVGAFVLGAVMVVAVKR